MENEVYNQVILVRSKKEKQKRNNVQAYTESKFKKAKKENQSKQTNTKYSKGKNSKAEQRKE